MTFWIAAISPQLVASPKIHDSLLTRLDQEGTARAWVFFADKGIESDEEYAAAIETLKAEYNPRAIERRALRRSAPGLFDERDMPVVQEYVDGVAATGVEMRVVSSWLNAVSVVADRAQIESIAALDFVTKIQPVRRSRMIEPRPASQIDGSAPPTRDDYGYSEDQLTQINVIALHNAGFTGAGVIVGVLDTGFERSHEAFHQPGHELNVIAEWDFVDNDPDTSIEFGDDWDQHTHGTMILGTLAAYQSGSYIGTAHDASFVLAKTEDVTGEYPAEEDNYVAGLQFIESNGADMATSSLGYIDWYSQNDLDGQTAVTTIAVNTATANGLICCTAAGNEGHDSNPNTSALIAPADAFQVITCGAVSSSGAIADFSSDGPTADDRVKPEVLAWGVDTITIWPYDTNGYAQVSGTSLSTPLVAGAVACLIQAHPGWSVDQMRTQLFDTADYYVANGTFDPQYVRGYGIIDAYAAHNTYVTCPGDLDGDGDVDLGDLGALLAHYPTASGANPQDGDLDGDGDVDLSDLSALLAVYGSGC